MNYQQQAHFKTLSEAEKIPFLRTLKPGLSDEAYRDWINWVESPVQHMERKPVEKVSFSQSPEYLERVARTEARLVNAQPTPEPDPVDYFRRDVLVNQYLMKGESVFDEASLYNPNLKVTEVVRWFRAVQPRTALIVGGAGAGKTWGTLAYMTSKAEARGNCKVEYVNAAFVTAFRLSEMFHNQKKFQAELDELLRKKHLLIDDLGAEPSGFRGSDFIAYFDYLFSERHRFRRSTYLTSNATLENIKNMYGDRFVSRFNDMGEYLETTDGDMRG